MNARVKAADIPDRDILEAIRRCSEAMCNYPMKAGYHGGCPGYGYDEAAQKRHWANLPDIARYDFPGFPKKVVRAKLASLIRRGLITGCACGCRGDFEMLPAGREAVG